MITILHDQCRIKAWALEAAAQGPPPTGGLQRLSEKLFENITRGLTVPVNQGPTKS